MKRDIVVAKNYLNEKELSRLNRLVTMFIDYAELMAEDEILMSMQDWVEQTNQFLSNNRRKVLDGKGKISHEQAVGKAIKEYDILITQVNLWSGEVNKSMTIEVTDPSLLDETGGIIQGMSGSPILQNGKLIGAVTHVFVNNPTKGYGIFAESMINESE